MNGFKIKDINDLTEDDIANFTVEQEIFYREGLKHYRDIKNTLDTAREEGEMMGKIKIAKNMLSLGIPVEVIMQSTGLSSEEIGGI